MTTRIRTYSEMLRYHTFEDRFEYLSLRGVVGAATFGHERVLNQNFYRSVEWRNARNFVIARDLGRDLAMDDHEIFDRILIHHMNPMRAVDIEHGNEDIIDPEFLITTTHRTHNAIHYGDASLLRKDYIPRRPGDTKLW